MTDIEWHGPEIKALLEGTSFEGIELAAEHLLQVSSDRAPLEEGTLARSGEVSSDRSQMTAAVSYDTKYAVAQHEHLDWRHDEGKTAKYLEAPMVEEREVMLALAAKPGQDLLGG